MNTNAVQISCSDEMQGYEDKKAIRACAERGLHLVIPPDNIATLDLDTDSQHTIYLKQLAFLRQRCPDLIVDIFYTKSEHDGSHVYLRLDSWKDDSFKCALQSILGSDPKRELLNLGRIYDEHMVFAMFETKEEFDKVSKWLFPIEEDEI